MPELTPELLAGLDLPGLLDGLPMGVAVVDLNGRVLTVNSALERLTGLSRAEVPGVPCRHVVRSASCLEGCPDRPGVDTDMINRHRRRIPVRISQTEVKSMTGQVLFNLHLVEDLTALRELERQGGGPRGVGQLVGKSPDMERIFRIMPAMAASEAPVFIMGETGTGKDAVAEALHKLSPRAREAFLRVNCGPTSPEALSAELFGRVTPAGELVPGAFQRAGAGTLYLSDVGELPEPQQAGLVAFLDQGLISPVGAKSPVHSPVRLMVSALASPEELARTGKISKDLASGLGALRLALPPLRNRREDIEFLLSHFLERFAAKFKKQVRGFSPKARKLLLAHDYPGNVRELRNIVEFAVMVCPKEVIPTACLPAHLLTKISDRPR